MRGTYHPSAAVNANAFQIEAAYLSTFGEELHPMKSYAAAVWEIIEAKGARQGVAFIEQQPASSHWTGIEPKGPEMAAE